MSAARSLPEPIFPIRAAWDNFFCSVGNKKGSPHVSSLDCSIFGFENQHEREDRMEQFNISRRHLLVGSASAAALLTASKVGQAQEAKPLPDYVAYKDPEALIVHSNNTLETERSVMGVQPITPDRQLYIRN